MSAFWDFIWLIIVSFVFIAYLIFLFTVIGDLIRDRETSGWIKAVWVLCFFFVPFVTALVYLIARGPGMNRRAAESAEAFETQSRAYIRTTAGTSPAQQISDAKSLLDAGVIDDGEYSTLKAKALSA